MIYIKDIPKDLLKEYNAAYERYFWDYCREKCKGYIPDPNFHLDINWSIGVLTKRAFINEIVDGKREAKKR